MSPTATADRVIALSSAVAALFATKLVGVAGREDQVGTAVSLAGDFDGDGWRDLVIGAPYRSDDEVRSSGAAYIVSARALRSADGRDGSADGVVELSRTHRYARSWRILGDERYQYVGAAVAARLQVGGPAGLVIGTLWGGSTYLLASSDLEAADAQDGAADGSITASNIAAQPDSWELVGLSHRWRNRGFVAVGDYDADGADDLLVGADGWNGDRRRSVRRWGVGRVPAIRRTERSPGALSMVGLGCAGMAVRRAGAAGSGRQQRVFRRRHRRRWRRRNRDRRPGGRRRRGVSRTRRRRWRRSIAWTAPRIAASRSPTSRAMPTATASAIRPTRTTMTTACRMSRILFQLDPAEWADADGDGYGDNRRRLPRRRRRVARHGLRRHRRQRRRRR